MGGLLLLQAVLFTACVLVGLLPSTDVACRFDVPVAAISPATPPAPPLCAPPPEACSGMHRPAACFAPEACRPGAGRQLPTG
jgi:hypothetical protein